MVAYGCQTEQTKSSKGRNSLWAEGSQPRKFIQVSGLHFAVPLVHLEEGDVLGTRPQGAGRRKPSSISVHELWFWVGRR